MSKTTPNFLDGIIIPPGTLTFLGTPESLGEINFEKTKSQALLSPLVEAYRVGDEITINAVIFVECNDSKQLTVGVFQNCYVDIGGDPQLQFFVCYDMDKPAAMDNFSIYEITFLVQPIPFDGGLRKIETIQTFLWNIDPVTSRGTVTTVQPGTGM